MKSTEDILAEILIQNEKTLGCLETQMQINKDLLERIRCLEELHPELKPRTIQDIINDEWEGFMKGEG